MSRKVLGRDLRRGDRIRLGTEVVTASDLLVGDEEGGFRFRLGEGVAHRFVLIHLQDYYEWVGPAAEPVSPSERVQAALALLDAEESDPS